MAPLEFISGVKTTISDELLWLYTKSPLDGAAVVLILKESPSSIS